jgi:hypothetical protein
MATSFSGGGNWSTRGKPPTLLCYLLFLFASALSVFRFTASDYYFGVFKLVLGFHSLSKQEGGWLNELGRWILFQLYHGDQF